MSEVESGLILQAQKGDISSFEALVRPYQTTLYRMALSITGNAEDAEDAFQETVLQAYRCVAKFRGEASFSTWLYRIAVNVGRNWVRSQARASSERFINKSSSSAEEYALGPEDAFMSREQAQTVHHALLELPEHYRDPLILRHYENLSYYEIADVLGIPIGTVRSRLAQGRKQLSELLSADECFAHKNRR